MKFIIKALPKDQQKQVDSQATKYALKQWQTWIALFAYFILMIASSLLGSLLGFEQKPMNIPFLIGMSIGMPLFIFTFLKQRQKSIIKSLTKLQQKNATNA